MPCGKPKKDGSGPCQQPAGYGREAESGPCRYHADDDEPVGSDGPRAREADGLDYAGAPFGRLQVERLVSALRDGATYEIAARSAGISPRTFLRWRTDYPALEDRVKRAEAASATDVLSRLQEAVSNGDTATMRWLLEKRHGYETAGDELPADEVRKFTDAVKDVIRRQLDEDTARRLIIDIGDELEELAHG